MMLWLRPDMTEKVFTGTLSKRKNKTKKHVSQNWPGHPGSVLPFFLHFFLNTGKIFRINFFVLDCNTLIGRCCMKSQKTGLIANTVQMLLFLLSLVDCSEN